MIDTIKKTPRGAVPKWEGAPARVEILEEASAIVNGPRNFAYGESEDNFGRIARLWRAFFKARYDLDVPLTPGDVGLIMILMKVARLAYDPDHKDSWVDLAGYAATGYQAQVAKPK